MAQTYTRQSSFIDGDTITAALFNDEYNQLVNAFAYSSTSATNTGHRHDGTAGQGGNIFKIGDLDFLNKVEIDSTNNRVGFYVEVSSAAVEQLRIQDGALVPVTDNDIDLGTSSLEFKDAFFDGTVTTDALVADTADIDGATIGANSASTGAFTSVTTTGNVDVGGNLTVTGTTTFNGGTLTLGDAADDNVVFGADVNSNIIPNTDNAYDLGSSSQEWKDLYVDGIAYLDGINFNGTAITSTAAELNILDGVTSTAAELNLLDGVTSTTAELNILDGVTSSTAELNILDGVTSTTAELNILDGVTSTAAELNILDGVTSTAAELNILDGVTSTATELNLLDGVTATTTELNYVDVTTAGTVEASKAVVADSNADVLFSDNDKLKFGTDSDLQIYHDGSSSFIQDAGTGDLEIKGENNVRIKTNTGGENMAAFTANGAVSLFHDNSEKFSTTSSGVNITGTVVADGLTVDSGTTNTVATFTSTDAGAAIQLTDTTGNSKLETSGANLRVSVDDEGAVASSAIQFRVDGSTKATINDSGVLDVDGGITVDNITIDGTEIDLSSGDLTLDVAGNIVLNADGGGIQFYDDSAYIGSLGNSSGDFSIMSRTDDEDIVFKGIDGGSTITALTLDMSAGGTASFSHDIEMVDNGLLRMGAGGDLILSSDGTNGSIFANNGALILDADSDIHLDANGADILLKDGGTTFGELTNSSTDFVIKSHTSDKDIIFKGNDGGSEITALTLDMSNSGAATFNGNVTINGVDVTIPSNIIHAGDSDTFFGFNDADTFRIVTGGSEALRVDSSQRVGIGTSSPSTSHKLTVSGDTKFTGQLSILDNQLIKMGDGEDFALYHDTTVGNVIKSATSDMDISILGNDGGSTITALKFDMSAAGRAVFNAGANFSDHVNFDDNAKAVFGGGDDLQIYHDGSNSIIKDAGTGNLQINAASFVVNNAANSASIIVGEDGGSIELYENGSKKIETTSSGATVTGTLVSDGLTVDTSTLVVDATNNRVGIGNASPDVSLDIGSLTDAIHVPVGTTAQRPTGAAGYFRYNSETGKFEGFTNEWGAIAGGGSGTNMDTNIFAGDGSDTTFTLSTAPDSENNLMVFIDGVFQAQNVYSVSGTTLTFATAPANGRVITVYHSTTTVGGSNNSIATMTGDGSDTTLTLSTAPVHENNVSVFFDGVYQSKSNYSISGTTLTFSTAPPSGVAVEAITATNTSITTATQLSDADGDTLIQTEESSDEDKIRFDTGGTERMIIDDSGNVGIGETSPLATLHIKQGDSGLSSLNAAAHHLFLEDTGANGPGITLASGTTSNCSLVFGDSDSNYQGFILYDNSADAMKFGTNGGSERMRILSGGNVLLNQTATADSGVADGRLEITRGSQHCINCHVTGTGNSTLVAFINDNGFVGGINTNGSATAFNTSSDARLKNVLGEAKGLEIVNALNPVNFEWKSDGKIQDGLIAQEVEKVFPEAVSEPELEGEWYSVDYSKLVTPLIKAMQEQQELIETQQTTINDLKTRIETLES